MFRNLFECSIFAVALISGLLIGFVQSATTTRYSSTFSGALSSSSQLYQRPDGYPDEFYYFQAIQVTVSASGTYVFTSDTFMDPIGYLYNPSFDPSNPTANLITDDDDSGDEWLQFKIESYLTAGRPYVLVVTTHSDTDMGSFTISVDGPAPVGLTSFTPSTSRPLVTPSGAPAVSVTISSALSSSSQYFVRPDGDTDESYYFQAIQVSVSMSGLYIFTSDSNLDTMGYFYEGPFDAFNPSTNLLVDDDDSGDVDFQFRLEVFLQPGRMYILIVTTHRESVTGSFSVSVGGPTAASLTLIMASTSQPIVTPSSAPSVSVSTSGSLSSSSQVFTRPGGENNKNYYLQAIQINVSTSGTYVFTSNSALDTMGYFYETAFDPSEPLLNLILDDDDSGDIDFQFRIPVYLEAGRVYILVVTTHRENAPGSFSVSATGPAAVGLTSIMASTSRPIVTQSTTTKATINFGGTLSSRSPIFYRPEGSTRDYYYYQAVEITVSRGGTYVFTSNSSVDTMAYFYHTSFDPSDPTTNLITDDDDSGDEILQFQIEMFLVPGAKYILVVTTHREYAMGRFTVSAIGPASVSYTTITPSTSRPMITVATPPHVFSSYASTLSSSSSVFFRPEGGVINTYYFQALQLSVTTGGFYIFTSNSSIDTRGYFYQTSFDPSNPTRNLVTEDDDSGSRLQFRIQVYLQTGRTYVLVATTHREYVTGNFSIFVDGPASVTLTFINPSTSQPIVTQSTTPSVPTSYPGELRSSSSFFQRPGGDSGSSYFFQAVQVTASIAGIYSFTTVSAIDTRGYFYQTSFDPSDPTVNLIADNDDGGSSLQFRLQVRLETGRNYIVVVTTHRESVIGNFSLIATGIAVVNLMPITPSTSRPITTRSTTPSVPTSYPGALSSTSSTFNRPGATAGALFYYQAIQVSTSVAGTYVFTSSSSIDTRGYFYRTYFDPSNGTANLLADNDDGGSSLQFRIQVFLDVGRIYILVVTTHTQSVTGSFSVEVRGPATVSLMSFTPTTRAPTTTVTAAFSTSSIYANAILPNGPTFYRANGNRDSAYYFDAVQVTVSFGGTYSFTSSSYMDTVGYLYTAFNPSDPMTNMITYDDNSGVDAQFLIQAPLEAGRSYILVVTTARNLVTGTFWVSVVGPASVSLVSVTSSVVPTATAPTVPNTPQLTTTLKSSISVKTNPTSLTIIGMLVMPMLRVFQQRFV